MGLVFVGKRRGAGAMRLAGFAWVMLVMVVSARGGEGGATRADPQGNELWVTALNSVVYDMEAIEDVTGDSVKDVAIGGLSDLVYCLDGYTGVVYWTGRTSGTVWSVAGIGDADWDGVGDVAAGTAANEVYLYSGGGGAAGVAPWIWTVTTSGDVWDVAAIGDTNSDDRPDVLAGTAGDEVLCLSGLDGTELWRHATVGDVWTVAAAPDRDGDGVREALAGTAGDKAIMLDGATGALLWSYSTIGDVWKAISAPDLNGDGTADVVVGTAGNKVVAISGRYDSDSTTIWEFATGGDVRALAVLGDVTGDGVSDILAGSLDGNCYAIDGATGAQIWAQAHLGEVTSVVGIADASRNGLRDAALGTAGSRTRCLEGTGGSAVWSYPFPTVDPCIAVATPGDIHGDGYDEVFSLSEAGEARCLATRVLSAPTGFSRETVLKVDSTGQVYVMVYDFDSNASVMTLDGVGQVEARFLQEPGHWTSTYLYDYTDGSWQSGAALYLETY